MTSVDCLTPKRERQDDDGPLSDREPKQARTLSSPIVGRKKKEARKVIEPGEFNCLTKKEHTTHTCPFLREDLSPHLTTLKEQLATRDLCDAFLKAQGAQNDNIVVDGQHALPARQPRQNHLFADVFERRDEACIVHKELIATTYRAKGALSRGKYVSKGRLAVDNSRRQATAAEHIF